MAGRGAGKTRSAMEDCSDYARTTPDARIALVAPTIADVRDVLVEGESGLLAIVPDDALWQGNRDKAWNRSMMELTFANGARCKGYSSETPNRLRGPQHHRAYGDEPASWYHAEETWDMLMLGLRLGDNPRVVVTGTPKPTALIKRLVASPETHITHGTTFDNLANLAPSFAAQIVAKYEGTRLGRQELYAEILEDVEGALWTSAMFDAEGFRTDDIPPMRRVGVGVDPSGTRTGDACGIVAAGVDTRGRFVVLEDATMQGSPDEWARMVVSVYDRWHADRVFVEANFGGELAETVLHTVRPHLPVKNVHASRGKALRAEPVAALYEQGKAVHVGQFSELEVEMTSWFPGADWSPNRLDALVWAATELVLGDSGPPVSSRPAGRTLAKTPVSRYGQSF